MECDFLDYTGGILSGGYECKKTGKRIDRSTLDTYCDNSMRYRDCPIYRENGSSSGCYFTTVMCNILGYEDNCLVLNTLRNFRDNYMKNANECLPLLEDYNIISPIISEKLKQEKEQIFNANLILYFYILPAIDNIKKEKYDDAIEIYKDMNIYLMSKYGIDKSILASEKTIGPSITRKKEMCSTTAFSFFYSLKLSKISLNSLGGSASK